MDGLKRDCLGLSGTDLEAVLKTDFKIVQIEKSRLLRSGLAG